MGISSLRILSCHSVDSSPSIILTDQNGKSLLINCGEGCQRSFLEYPGMKIKKIKKICLTSISHNQIGGLPGFILTSSDIAAEDQQPYGIQVIGPTGTQAFIHSLRHFLRREKFPIIVREGEHYHNCEPESAKVTTVKNSRKKRKKQEDEDGHNDVDFSIQTIPISYAYENDHTISISTCSFVFTTPPIFGKFLPDKAKALGIPAGPLYARLKAGESVTFASGSTIQTVSPAEVLSSSSESVAVAILYCPNKQVFDRLQASSHLETLISGNTTKTQNGSVLDCIVHIASRTMIDEGSYQAFIERFGVSVQHIYMYTDENLLDESSPFLSACKGAVTRSLLQSQLFPVPFSCFGENGYDGNYDKKNSYGDDEKNGVESLVFCSDDVQETNYNNCTMAPVRGRPMMEYILVPRSRKGIDTSKVRMLSLGSVSVQEYQEVLDFAKTQGAFNSAMILQKENDRSGIGNDDGELIFTGTGSAIPCKHRNVTGMCLQTRKGRCIMLDVGEGTLGQLYRMWGGKRGVHHNIRPEIFDESLKNIKAVWISHPHADHHLGLLRLLSERNKCSPNNPITLVAPEPFLRFLNEYCKLDPSIVGSFIPFDCRDLAAENNISGLSPTEKLQHDLGISGCSSVPVTHCLHSYAIVIDGTAFGRVVYSGDCRPSEKLCVMGRGADLLIHEATFEDGMEEEASIKKHSTLGEAMNVGKKMEAKAVLLTHFSQRYPKIPPLPHEKIDSSVCVESNSNAGKELLAIFAFDFMTLNPGNLLLASKLTPALRLLYPDEQNNRILEDENVISRTSFLSSDW